MQMTISRRDLKAAVLGFSKIVPHKTTLPVLGCIKFEAGGKTVTATATDLDQQATYAFTDAVTEGTGAFTAGLSQLKDISKGPDGDRIEFMAVGKDKLSVVNPVSGQAMRLELPTIDPEEWPAQSCEVKTQPVDDFLAVFQRLTPFASTDSTRHVINSCFLDVTDGSAGKSVLVSTDGRRLTMCNTMTLPLKQSCIVPTTKFLAWLDGACKIGVARQDDTSWFAVETGPWTYHTKVIEGTYPNFKQVIPIQAGDNRITFADDVTSVRQLLKALPDEDTKGVVVFRAGQAGTLAVCAKGSDGKEVRIEMPGSTFTGKCRQYALNRGYLIDALDAGFKTFAFTDELSPIVSDDGKGGKHVLMPMRVDSPVQTVGSDAKAERTETPAATIPDKKQEQPVTERKHRMSKTDTAVEKLQSAYETAKDKVKDASAALADLASLIKDVVKEDKQRRSEIEDVRKTVAKIQSIKV